MGVNVEYLGRIGYNCGRLMQGFLINTHLYLQEIKSKKVILLGMGENSIYAEKSLKEKGIDIFGYADNSEKLQGRGIDGKNQIYSPYDLFPNDDYYFIITVKHDIATVRLQFMRYKIKSYGIFINHDFHDFCDTDEEMQKILMEALNIICFKGEECETALPYVSDYAIDGKNELGRINFLLYSTTWSHWAYSWERELIESKQYKEILEGGPGYGLMSLVFLKLFPQIHIDWMILGDKGDALGGANLRFTKSLQKIESMFADRLETIYAEIERDFCLDKKYDLIVLTEVFEHFVLNPVNTMKKIMKLLKEDGRIILTTPNWGHLHIYRSWEDMPNSEDVSKQEYQELLESVRYGHTYQYTKEELITIFERAGLKIERYDLSDSNGHNIVLVKNK